MMRIILGKVSYGPRVSQWIDESDIQHALKRHEGGHAGSVGFATHLHNFFKIENGFISAHQDRKGHKFVIVTNSLVNPPRTEVFMHAW